MRPYIAVGFGLFAVATAEAQIVFDRDIRPIFAATCWNCHGAQRMAGFDLRTRDTAIRAIVPGKAQESKLFRMVSGVDKPQMPMGATLPEAQVALLKQWIDEGAVWGNVAVADEKPWAYRTPIAKAPPGPGNPIDAFVNDTLKRRNILAAPRAAHQTLIRRLSLDLTGLPPAIDDLKLTYERAMDKYLASPHYGERWGRHWLDLARYADSNGYEHDFNRPNAWRYRDYVIRAFNADKPYDVFLREQIAGDELPDVTPDSLIATGFLRNYAKVGYREKDNPEFRFEYLDDMIATLGRGVMGLTVQCARCHNHKFDPISQRDYQKLQASLWGYVEVDHPLVPAAEAETFAKGNAEIDAKLAPLKARVREIEAPYKAQLLPAKLKRFPANVLDAIAIPEERRTEGQKLLANQVLRTTSISSVEAAKIMTPEDLAARDSLLGEIAALEKRRPAAIPVAMGISDGDFRFTPDGPGDEPAPGKGVQQDLGPGSFLAESDYRIPPGAVAEPGFPDILTHGTPPVALPPAHGRTSGRRLALAQWLSAPDHPLTARAFVNRVWHHHFGRGIVATPDNFGKMGEAATHPELLDWLAVEFVRQGSSVKKLHRLILTSDAYRRASGPDDGYLARFPAQRLEAEAVRDSILAAAGTLNRAVGGPAVFPPLAPEITARMLHGIWKKQPDGPDTWRRSVYVYRKRGLPFPFFEVFDLPDQNTSCARRNVSTVPTQALTLLNNEFVLSQASMLAASVKEATVDSAAQVTQLYERTLARAPDAGELQLGIDFLKTDSLDGLAHVLFNTSEFLYIR